MCVGMRGDTVRTVYEPFWYPVAVARLLNIDDVVWLECLKDPGYYEILAIRKGAILVRRLTSWEVRVRRFHGKWKRFWFRYRR